MTSADEWRNAVGDVWSREWERTDRAFAGIAVALDRAVLAAAPDGPFAALDIGSGAGATSLALAAARRDATITGVDLSEGLVAVARARAAERSGAGRGPHFRVGDATAAAAARAPLDLLFSRHGVMFFADPAAAFRRLHAAARPGAALVFSCFRDRDANPWAGDTARVVAGSNALPPAGDAPGPFAFADPGRVAAILAEAGWRDAAPAAVDTGFRVGAGSDPVADAVHFFSRIGTAAALLRALAPVDQATARRRLSDYVAGYRHGDTIDFPAAAWIWTAKA